MNLKTIFLSLGLFDFLYTSFIPQLDNVIYLKKLFKGIFMSKVI